MGIRPWPPVPGLWRRAASTLIAALFAAGCPSDSSTQPDADTAAPPPDAAAEVNHVPGHDCAWACGKASDLCSDLGSTWVDVCTTSCGNKLRIKPELAETEIACIEAAGDCTTATLCAKDL